MRVTLLGTGGPRPDPDRQGPAVLVQRGDTRLLVDCGRGVCTQLAKAGVNLTELDAVMVTHLHFDHVCDLGDVIMSAWNLGLECLPIIGPPGTEAMVAALLNDVYPLDIEYRHREGEFNGTEVGDPGRMVDVRTVGGGDVWESGDIAIRCETVDHGDVLDMEDWTALGYRLEAGTATLAVSGDAVPCRGLTSLAMGVDVLVQCCYLSDAEIDSESARRLSERILGGAPQAVETAVAARPAMLVLTHLRQKSDDELARLGSYIGRRFGGEVRLGHDLMSIDI